MSYEQEIQEIEKYHKDEMSRGNEEGWGFEERREILEWNYDKLLTLAKKMQEEHAEMFELIRELLSEDFCGSNYNDRFEKLILKIEGKND